MKQIILGLAVSLLLTSISASAEHWESLTPDNSLNGWRVLSGEWHITEDGIIIGKAPADVNGWLLYEHRPFADFEISFEFRTQTPTNGGVQIRSHWLPRMPLQAGEAVQEAPNQMYGYQAGIDTRRRQGTGTLMDKNGRGYLAGPGVDATKTLKRQEWNAVRVSARGNVITVYLNDMPACRIEDEAFINGHIALQVYPYETEDPFHEIEYRNVRVKDYGREGIWRALFDGATLDGWKEWGEEDWQVEAGVIWGRSGPRQSEGYLATTETFKDFRVRGAFKMTGDGNYGLFYHSTIRLREEDNYPIIAGLQGEVEPSYPGNTGWIYESYQRGWLVDPDRNTVEAAALRVGAWNEIEIRSSDNHVTTWVNGMRVLDLVDDDQRLFEGSFALQLHTGGAEGIGWRDIYVLESP